MLKRWLDLHKPRATRSTQLVLADGLWTLVGVGLSLVGLYWILDRYGGPGLAYAAPFLVLGGLKAVFILDRVARRAVERIERRTRDDCAGGFFSATSWGLIVTMMVLGQILRMSPLPRSDIGFVYLAAGTGLLVSSRILWRMWRQQ